jgi:hypothetical protein
MPASRASAWRTGLWAFLLLAGVLAVGAIGFDVLRRATGMEAARTSAAAVLAADAGRPIKAVVQLGASQAPDVYDAIVLESGNGRDYRETGTHIRVARAAGSAIVMGGPVDIGPGAVVQANGTLDAAHVLHAREIVVLTGYVHVVSGP